MVSSSSAGTVELDLGLSRRAVDRFEKSIDVIARRAPKIDLGARDATRSIDELKAGVLEARAALTDGAARTELLKQAEAIDKAAIKQDALTLAAKRYEQQLQDIEKASFSEEEKDRLREMAAEFDRLTRLRIDKEFDRAADSVEDFNDNLGRSVVAYQALADGASAAFGFIAGQVKSGIDLYTQFEGTINTFGAVSGSSSEQLALISEEARRLGASTAKTANDAAQAAVEFTKLGFSAEETAQELGGLVNLAIASGESVESSAKITGAVLSVFKDTGIDAQATADLVAKTAASSAASANDFLQVVSKAGAIAKANNQDLVTLASTFGLLRNSGFSAETAATALKTTISRLAAPSTEKAKKAIEELGVEIRGSDGEMRNLLELVPEFREALANVAPAKSAELTNIIFGAEAGPAFIALTQQAQTEIDKVANSIRNFEGAAGAASTQQLQGLTGTLQLLSSASEGFVLTVGQTFAPAVEMLAQGAISVLNGFSSLSEPTQRLIILTGGVVGAISGLIVAYQTLQALQIVAIAKEIALNSALSAKAVVTTTVTAATKAYAGATALAAGGVGAMTAAITPLLAVLGLAAAAFVLWKNNIEFVNAVINNQFTKSIDAGREELAGFLTESKTTDASLKELGQTIEQEIPKVNSYGESWRFVSKEQIQAQQSMLGLDKLLGDIGQIYDAGIDTLNEYGLATKESAAAANLSAGQVVEFKKAVEGQVEAIDKSIEVLRNQTGATEEQQMLIDSNIASLETQKRVLLDRVDAVDDSTEATKNLTSSQIDANAEAEKAEALLKQQTAALQAMGEAARRASAELSTAQSEAIAAVRELQAAQDISAEEAEQRITQIKQDGLADRVEAEKAALAEIREAREAGTINEQEAIDAEIAARNQLARSKTEAAEFEINLREEAAKEQERIQREADRARKDSIKEQERLQREAERERAKEQRDRERAEREIQQEQEKSLSDRTRQFGQMATAGEQSFDRIGQAATKANKIVAGSTGDAIRDATRRAEATYANILLRHQEAIGEWVEISELLEQVNLPGLDPNSDSRIIQSRIGNIENMLEPARRQFEEQKALEEEARIAEEQARIEEEQARIAEEQNRLAEERAAVEEQINNQLQQRQQALDVESQQLSAQLDARRQAADIELASVTAQAELRQSQLDLELVRLDAQLRTAELAGNTAESDRIREEILARQGEQLQIQIETDRRKLELAQEQQRIELEREQTLARIALAEIEAEIIAARQLGKSAEEIQNLQAIANLRSDVLNQISEQAAALDRIQQIERDTLAVNQEISREKFNQAVQEERRAKAEREKTRREESRSNSDRKQTNREERSPQNTRTRGDRSDRGNTRREESRSNSSSSSLSGGNADLGAGSSFSSSSRSTDRSRTRQQTSQRRPADRGSVRVKSGSSPSARSVSVSSLSASKTPFTPIPLPPGSTLQSAQDVGREIGVSLQPVLEKNFGLNTEVLTQSIALGNSKAIERGTRETDKALTANLSSLATRFEAVAGTPRDLTVVASDPIGDTNAILKDMIAINRRGL